MEDFDNQRANEIVRQGKDDVFSLLSKQWFDKSCEHKYSYHFDWLSRPIIQYPQDIVALQEIIYAVEPDLIIECGVARGGSLIFSASMLALLEYCKAVESRSVIDPTKVKSKVLGIDIDIRRKNLAAITAHPLSMHVDLIEGSSTEPRIVEQVTAYAKNFEKILVILDSNHTHSHVLGELKAYAELVTVGSYCIVFDTVIENMPDEMHLERPWSRGNNPKTAVMEFLQYSQDFEVDKAIDDKLSISVAPNGYLKRLGKR